MSKRGSGPTSRIPLPTGRYFLNLSPNELSGSNRQASGNLRPPKSGSARRPNMDKTMPLESPSSHRVLTPVGQPSREGRELYDVHKASATSLSSTQHVKATPIEANTNTNNNDM